MGDRYRFALMMPNMNIPEEQDQKDFIEKCRRLEAVENTTIILSEKDLNLLLTALNEFRMLAFDEEELKEYRTPIIELNTNIVNQIIDAADEKGNERIGKWVYKPRDYADGVYECSVCKEPYYLDDKPSEHNYHFCPNCGARMEGEEMADRNKCKHCMGITLNAIGEEICSCEFYGEDEGRNITLGECFGNCEGQEE